MSRAEIALHLVCLDMERMHASKLGRPISMENVSKMEQNYLRRADCGKVRSGLAERFHGERS